MGPPPFSGGEHRPASRTPSPHHGLQWGRRLSAAERRAEQAASRHDPASMGPPPFSGGRGPARARTIARRRIASMGPPPFSGGEWHRSDVHRSVDASLGPPPFSGGGPARPASREYGLLQWGRRLSAAESPAVPSTPRPCCWLQWGRRLSAAESVLSGARRYSGYKLQWGRRLSAAEGRRALRAEKRLSLAAAFQRRRVSQHIRHGDQRDFTEAAAQRRRGHENKGDISRTCDPLYESLDPLLAREPEAPRTHPDRPGLRGRQPLQHLPALRAPPGIFRITPLSKPVCRPLLRGTSPRHPALRGQPSSSRHRRRGARAPEWRTAGACCRGRRCGAAASVTNHDGPRPCPLAACPPRATAPPPSSSARFAARAPG